MKRTFWTTSNHLNFCSVVNLSKLEKSPVGYVYLFHIGCAKPGRPRKDAKALGEKCFHYLGHTTRTLKYRVNEHLTSHPNGATIIKKALEKGLKVKVVRVWPRDGNLELYIKDTKRVRDFCPCCNKNPRQVRPDWKTKMRKKHDQYWLRKKGWLDQRY